MRILVPNRVSPMAPARMKTAPARSPQDHRGGDAARGAGLYPAPCSKGRERFTSPMQTTPSASAMIAPERQIAIIGSRSRRLLLLVVVDFLEIGVDHALIGLAGRSLLGLGCGAGL